MYKPIEHKTVEELLLDAYKAQVSTYVRLLEVKDAQVASLEERIRDLEMKLDQCNNTEVRPQESFGEKVRLLRQERKLTMKELGEKVGLTESAIGMIERGERNPSFPKLCDIARFFKVDIDSLTDVERSSTGLTAKEREEIEKLSKEIMDEPTEENEWPEEMTIEFNLEDFNKTLREALTSAFGILDDSKQNTTTENSDANGPCANPYPNRQESIVERYLSFRNSFTKLKWFELERLIESKFNEKAGMLLLDDSDIDSILQQFESSKD